MLKRLGPSSFHAARSIVTEALAANWREGQAGTSQRGLTLVFLGENQTVVDSMTQVVEDFVAADDPAAGSLLLGCGSASIWDGVRAAVHARLRAAPRSLVVLRCAHEAPPDALKTLEDAFENRELQVADELD